jgi:hypothetical protein
MAAHITFWQIGTVKCVLVLENGLRELRLTDGEEAILRTQRLLAEDSAADVAERWRCATFVA